MTRKAWVLGGAAVLVAVIATGVGVVMSPSNPSTVAAQGPPASTATVERGSLSSMVALYGTLTYRGRPDGSPYAVINRAAGIYTRLPRSGDKIRCGDVLYRVNDKPVLLLCGPTPAFRALSQGAVGSDVAELTANLVHLGYANRAQLDPADSFTAATVAALAKLQSKWGWDQPGSLDLGRAVFLPEALRIATVAGEPGATAQPGARVMYATSGTLEVQVALDPSQQGEVKVGDRAQITLPANKVVTGHVDRLGRVAQVPAAQNTGAAGYATIPASISLDHPEQVRGLDRASVQVNIATRGVENALSVPATAIVGRSGGFAVEVVRAGGRRELVPVKLGLFDTSGGRVQVVQGDLRQGDRVVVPSP